MSLKFVDRVQETTTTTGTGSFALGGAVANFATFASALSTADTCYYCCSDPATGAWETGLGTFTSPSTLARTTLHASSTGSAVSFAVGTKNVFVTVTGTGIQAQLNAKAALAGNASQAFAVSTVNDLTPTAAAVGFTIAGGSTSKTLTVPLDASVSGTLVAVAGKTFTTSNTLTLAGTDSTTQTFPPASANIGYLEIPQNSQSADYTCVAADSGKHIYHPSADTTARTWTIPANGSVPYALGTSITFVNDVSGGVITIAITTDTLKLAGTGATGSRSLAANGIATAVKVTTTTWFISGLGLS